MRTARLWLLVVMVLTPPACSSSGGSDQGPPADGAVVDSAPDLAAPDGSVTLDAAVGADTADLGIADPTEQCVWAPLQCSMSTSGCSCLRACEGHVHTMTCDGSSCACATDGTSTGSSTVAAACGSSRLLAAVFASGCSPGVMPGTPPTADCAMAPPQVAATPGGCVYSKDCGGHAYNLLCPSGYPCYCASDGVLTQGPITADCTDENALGDTFTQGCGFP
jgi:hypothetical protein